MGNVLNWADKLEESEKYWSSAPIEEKKKIIQFSHQKDSLNTNYSILLASKYMEVVSTTNDDNINLVKIFLFKNSVKF